MKILLISLLLSYIIGNNYEIKGKVTDRNTGEELTGVRIILNEKDTVYTDFDGNFILYSTDSVNVLKLNYISYDEENFNLNINNSICEKINK